MGISHESWNKKLMKVRIDCWILFLLPFIFQVHSLLEDLTKFDNGYNAINLNIVKVLTPSENEFLKNVKKMLEFPFFNVP